jgi:hypothetical protein
MKERIVRPPNWHHTLYYKRNFEKFSYTYEWREHPVMFVPMSYYEHVDLHNAVKPVEDLPSKDLTIYALGRCAGIQAQSGSLTRLEAFTDVRDELEQFHRLNRASDLGKEALRYSEQFTRQLEYMSEVPILCNEWNNEWMPIQRLRVAEKLLLLKASEQ